MHRRDLIFKLLAAQASLASVSLGVGVVQAAPRRKRKPTRTRRAAPAIPWMKGNLPNVQAPGALVLDLDSNQTLYDRRSDQQRPIASISKLASMLVLADREIDYKDVTTISKEDADATRGGARSRLLTGLQVSNLDLLHAAMLGSDNRAVLALGRAAKLSPAALTAEMNRKVRALGLQHTSFREPTGLSRENVSTPRECVALLERALEHPVLAPVLGRLEYDAHPVSRPAIHYTNTYRPALRANTQILGGKTGYNDFARYCLVLTARIDGHRFGMCFLGNDGKMTRFGDFARVADWLVAHKPHRKKPAVVASP